MAGGARGPVDAFLVRHGARGTGPDPELTTRGRAEAARAAELIASVLSGTPVGAIISSPRRRTLASALPVRERWPHAPYVVDERVRERIEFDPTVPGADWDAFLADWHRSARERDWQPARGSSSRDAGARVGACLSERAGALPAPLVVVSHEGALTDYLRDLLGDGAVAELLSRGGSRPGSGLPTGSVLTVRREPGAVSVAFADAPDLAVSALVGNA